MTLRNFYILMYNNRNSRIQFKQNNVTYILQLSNINFHVKYINGNTKDSEVSYHVDATKKQKQNVTYNVT